MSKKQVKVTETTTTIDKHQLEQGRFSLIGLAKKMAAQKLECREPCIKRIAVVRGILRDEIEIVWEP